MYTHDRISTYPSTHTHTDMNTHTRSHTHTDEGAGMATIYKNIYIYTLN